MTQKFVHLHTHSHYSLLDGLSKIDQLVKLAKEDGMPALALTDHGNLYGAMEFYKACKKEEIKPIIGVEVYIAKRTRFDKEPGIDNKRYHLTLLAKNEKGYKNLIRLVTLSNLEGFYYKPRVDKEVLKKYNDGIICLSGCLASELSQFILNKENEKAENIIKEYQNIFGKDNYFLEIMKHPNVDGDERVRNGIINLGKKFNIPLVATQDSHYQCSGDKKAHETLLAVQTNYSGKEKDGLTFGIDDFSLIKSEEAEINFKDFPEAIKNTLKIADMCNLELKLGRWVFPNIDIPKNSNYDDELKKIVYEGLNKLKIDKTKEVIERIDYELKIIKDKGYSPYFLVVADLLQFAKENKILTNTRGSAAGSIVSYLAEITNINPLKYNLPFERFLNPERPSPPDIDMDFADNRRVEVIEYVKKKYGQEKVAQIGTFGTMMAKAAVRDVARALNYSYDIGDKIAKLIPFGSQGFTMTIARAMEMVPELKEIYKKGKEVKEIIDLAKKLEGCVRHISVHAAGVVISPVPLSEFVPTQFDPKGGKLITQYDMHAVEDAGLLKFDFLGIRNLAILGEAIERVKKIRNIDIDIKKIDLEDKKTYQMLSKGKTMGVFQLSSSGMTRFLKELKPTQIEDIIAMVALYRPGPMQFIPEYIKRKHNPELINYFEPRLKEILKPTYGILIYQDDILRIANQFAGYTMGQADKFRKAVGKKIPKEMAAQKEKFISGCVDGGMIPGKAIELWKMIETFAAYGFNKAHAASYGLVAYQTAYMKANYPAEYMTALLTAESGDIEKISEIIIECKKMNFEVLPPDINESFSDFTIVRDENNKVTNKIRFGLRSIKNFGEEIGKVIIHERKEKGKFKSIADFLERITHRNLNKKSLEALIKCGTMDNLGERGQLIKNMDIILEYNKEADIVSNQETLFVGMDKSSLPSFKLQETKPADKREKLKWEKELLGLYISGHPLDRLKDKLKDKGINIKKIKENSNNGMMIVVAGIVEEARSIITKNNQQMAFVKLADLSDSIEIVVFPNIFKKIKELLEKEKCLLVKGRVSLRNSEKSVIVEEAKEI